MARILTDETTLHRKRSFLHKETRALRLVYKAELGLGAAALLAAAIATLLQHPLPWLWVLGALLLFLGWGHRLKVRDNEKEHQAVSAGLKGEASVTHVLSQALGNDSYILNDLRVRHGWKRAQMDHLVVTPHGIFVVETKTWRGEISGREDEPFWTQVRRPGTKPIQLRNPILQNRRQVETLRLFLRDEGIDWPDIYPVLVSRSPDAIFWVESSSVPILKPAEAARYIAQQRSSRTYTEAEVTAVNERLQKRAR